MATADLFADPVLEALTGPHAGIAERVGAALRYPPAVTSFLALPEHPSAADWDDAAALLGRDSAFVTGAPARSVPSSWQVLDAVEAHVMAPARPVGARSPDVLPLTPEDVPAMVELAAATRPGPFGDRTIELGGYVGIKEQGVLVAMGGTRLRGAAWTEISAVCTARRARG